MQMPDHFWDELDRDEIDLWGDAEGGGIRGKLHAWLGIEPSPLQEVVAAEKVQVLDSLAASIGGRIEMRQLFEGRRLVERMSFIDRSNRVRVRGARRVAIFLSEEIGF